MTATEAVRLYTIAEVAEVLRVSTDYVYDRIREGVLARVDLGTSRAKQRIRADVLQKFIDSRSFGNEGAK